MAKVMIDAGHGGYDAGASYQGRLEKEDNLDIALAVGEILEQNGVEVEYTRVTDIYDSPVRKAQIANEAGADFFVSIHRNSSPNPNTYAGVQTLVYDDTGIKAVMAENINQELAQVGFQDLGVSERTDLAVLRRTQMPSVLVEVGFINTDVDNQILDQNFDAVAQAIANGIRETIGAPATGGTGGTGRTGGYRYRVQVGLFRNQGNALREAGKLEALGLPVRIVPSGDLFAVQVGDLDTLEEGRALERELRMLGYDTLLVAE